jgi:cell division protein FtsB
VSAPSPEPADDAGASLPAPRDAGAPALRASDLERERCAELLREATGEGRLTLEELDERLTAAFAARHRVELEVAETRLTGGRTGVRRSCKGSCAPSARAAASDAAARGDGRLVANQPVVSSSTTTFPRGARPGERRPGTARPEVTLAWGRIGRIALVIVLLVLASSYVRPLLDWVSANGQAAQQEQRLAELTATQKRLEARKRELLTARGMVAQAQELGMVKPGQRLYWVRGLPKD